MPFRLSTHFLRLGCLIVLLSIVLSTILRFGGTKSESALRVATERIAQPNQEPVVNRACGSELEQNMFEAYGLIGCLAAAQYGKYAELVFEMFWETEEFREVVKRDGTTKVVPILLNALTNPEAFKLMVIEYRVRNALGATLKGIGKSIVSGTDAISVFNEEASKVREASRALEPQEFAFLLLYAMRHEGGSFLDQFHVLAIDHVETVYSQHTIHFMSSLLTSGITVAERKYRFDRDNFDWVKDGGNAALDAALLTVPFMGKWVLKAATGTKTAKAVKVSKVGIARKAAKLTGVALGITAVGYGLTHPWNTFWAINSAGQKLAELIGIPLASLVGPTLGWVIAISVFTFLIWPIAVPLYLLWKTGGTLARAVAIMGIWLFPRKEQAHERS